MPRSTADPIRLRIEVWVRRGAIVESRHRVQAVVVDADGRLCAATEAPDLVTTFRSAAKPFQLLPLVERGHADRLGCDDEELAVMASSHTGSARHVVLVQRILDRIGLTADRLRCGVEEPLDPESRARLAAHPEERSALYNNCSGKHAGMLALACAEGWPIEGYQLPDHPVQQLMHRTIAGVCELATEQVLVAVDGCSVSVFGLPLERMARAYARFGAAVSTADPGTRALARIRSAMLSFPAASGGAGRLSTALIEATSGRCVAKGGAEGLECVAVPEARLGLAVKCEDGQNRGVGPAAVAVLGQLGVLTDAERGRLAEWDRPVLQNLAGLEVATLEARLDVLAHASP